MEDEAIEILVLGGAGAMAQVTVRDLQKSKAITALGIADIDFQKARQFTEKLKDDRVIPLRTDVRKASKLTKQMHRWDVVINSTWYEFNLHVMAAAIRAGIHYLDLGGLYHMTLKQLKLHREAKKAGVTCVLGMGSTPGTMNVMAAHAASRLDRVQTIKLRSGSVVVKPSQTFQPPFSIRTILDEFTLPAPILRNGKIREIPPHRMKQSFVLPKPVGIVEGYVAIHSELATLPFTIGKGLRNMDFAIAYPKEFTELMLNLIRLRLVGKEAIVVHGEKIRPYDFLLATIGNMPAPTDVELDVDIQRVEAHGIKDGRRTQVIMDCISYPNRKHALGGGAVGTGTPPSIIAQWLAEDKIQTRGTLPPEVCIKPQAFFDELRKAGRGIEIQQNTRLD